MLNLVLKNISFFQLIRSFIFNNTILEASKDFLELYCLMLTWINKSWYDILNRDQSIFQKYNDLIFYQGEFTLYQTKMHDILYSLIIYFLLYHNCITKTYFLELFMLNIKLFYRCPYSSSCRTQPLPGCWQKKLSVGQITFFHPSSDP